MSELHVDRDKATGRLQVSIWGKDRTIGYRIAGPKYTGASEPLISQVLEPRDIREILIHLRHDFQHPPGGGYLCRVCAVQFQYHDRFWGPDYD